MKGFPCNICELVQLMGRFKRGSDKWIKQYKNYAILSLPCFTSIYYSVMSEENENEMRRQLNEMRNVTSLVMCQNKCILQSIEEYCSALAPNPKLTCTRLYPSYHG